MPLCKVCSLESFNKNLAQLKKDGRPFNECYAIAMRTLKESCGIQGGKKMSPKQV